MAEVLLSPGVLARENDQTFISAQPIQAGAAIVGPTVKGPVSIPTLVTSYSEYQNKFGAVVESGSAEYTYLTSISAYNYFQQGGDSLLVTRVVSGSYTSATSTPVSNSLNNNAFTLETLSEGVIMNSTSTLGSAGQLANGTADNIRWEVVQPDTAKGTFSLLIRRGNDTTNSKTVLETFANVSLDPNSNDYIEKVIGNSKQTVADDSGDYYIKNDGTFNTISRFVRVKEVKTPTLNYFDNAGNAKSAFTGSIPVAASGTFGSATGTDFTPSNSPALFNDSISNTNSQGFDSVALGDTTSTGTYGVAFNLLNNQDLFQYNLITAPGLIKANAAATGELTTMVNNSQTRGDNLSIVDLVNYNSGINTITAGAAAIDSSYAATYWPWLQTIDPDTNKTVWVPASTMIPGVYAFNDRSTEAWFAPAGLNRGGLSTVVRAERNLTNGNRNTLYGANINPIATFPNTGVVVFGQKTLQKKASSLDRVNVRRLLITLKNFISQIADQLVFEQNTIATRNNFLSQVNPYLASVQQRQGLYAFKVVMDESNNTPDVIDRNELIGQIFIQPTRTAEFIYLDFNILPTGATFPS
jgi:phage tail sheath protein FI